jgi:hypothetical protein
MNQTKKIEIQNQYREGQERIEKERKKRLEEHIREKEREMIEEQRIIKKREKEAKRLEQVEAEIL